MGRSAVGGESKDLKCCFVTGSRVGQSAVVRWGVKGLEVLFRHR